MLVDKVKAPLMLCRVHKGEMRVVLSYEEQE